MSEPVSISSGIAARYGTAVFELARDTDALAALESDVDALRPALAESADLRDLIVSPIYSRAEQADAMAAVAERMGLSTLVINTLRLMASKRRLFVLPQMLDMLDARIAEEKGEVTADVTAAKELSPAQADRLASALKKSFGKDVKLNMAVDAALIGGLVVRVGSKMIDTSIRAKLAGLQNAMKEVA